MAIDGCKSVECSMETWEEDEPRTVLDCSQSQAERSINVTHPPARHLLILQTTAGEKIITLDAASYSIGRHQANSIVIDDTVVSRQHAILLRIPTSKNHNCFFRIIDGNLQGKRSQNGLWINGKRCYSHDLRNNDVILFSNKVAATYYQVGDLQRPGSASPSDYPQDEPTLISGEEQEHLSEAALVRLSSFPELTPQPILEMELDGSVTYLNASANKHFPGVYDQLDHPVRAGLHCSVETYSHDYCEIREVTVGSRTYEQSIHWIPQSNLIRCYFTDITQRRQMEESVRKSEERFALAARGANDGLWDWDIEKDTLYLSPRWKSMIGYGEQEPFERIDDWFNQIHPEDRAYVQQEIDQHLDRSKPYLECQYRLKHQEGGYLYFRCRGIAVFDATGKPLRMAGSMTDITEYYRTREQLLRDALHDSMTGLANRILLLDRIQQAMKSLKRDRHKQFGLLFIDLDRFKIINDSLGHTIGDKLLIEVAQRLQTCVREEDTVARLGGDEFVVFLKEVKNTAGATRPAQRILESLRNSYTLAGREVFTSASIGIVLSNPAYEQPEEMLRDADMAMYEAKHKGKDNYAIFDSSMHSHAMKILEIENSLRLAIENQDFELYYQPILDLKTGEIRSFEALIRWCHPDKGLISPADFIPLAEDTGLIIPLGNWIIKAAFQQLRQWIDQDLSLPSLSICINISGRQFSNPDFVTILQRMLKDYPVPPENIELEITEGAIMHREDLVIEKLHQLKEIGFKLSIDDFGTGYSSLSYLQLFPVDTLKVDRSFVSQMGDHDSYEIVKTIMTLAHNLNLDVVAEGVEDSKQATLLQAMNCEYAQGYLYSPPLSTEKATRFLADSQGA